MRSLYPANSGGSKELAQFGLRPFDFYRLELSGSDEPVYYKEFSGTGLYIERCDYPATITVTDSQTRVAQSFVMRPGLRINCSFSGFTIQVPTFSIRRGVFADIVVCKGGAQFDNSRSESDIQSQDSLLTLTDTAVLSEFSMMIPPGASILRRLEIGITATTLTHATITPVENGIVASGRGGVIDPRNNVTYAVATLARGYGTVTAAGAGIQRVVFDDLPFWLRNNALYIRFVGTGLALANMTAVSRFE